MKTRPNRINARLDANRVLDAPQNAPAGWGFVSRAQGGAFALCCLSLLVSPLLFSGFWPVDHQLGTQSFFSVLAACAALLLALSPTDEMAQSNFATTSTATKLLLGFFAWSFLSCVASVYWHDTILEIARVGTCAAWFLILRELLCFGVAKTDNRVLELRALCVLASAVLGLSIICVLALDNFWQTRNPRQFGTFFNPNLFANACAMTLPLSLAATLMAWKRARRERPQTVVWVLTVGAMFSFAILGGLIVTSSKGGFLAAIVALGVFAVGLWRAQKPNLQAMWRRRRALISVVVLVAFLGGGALATKTVLPRLLSIRTSDDNSTQFRLYTWKSTLEMAKSSPLFGWAPGGFAVAHDQFAVVGTTKTAHQSWLQISAENGFPALILLVAATIAFLVRGWKNLKTESWAQSLGAMSAVVAFAVHGLTDAGWSVSSIVFVLMLTFALLDFAPENRNLEYSNGGKASENASRLRWNWLLVVVVTGAFSYAAQRAANGEDAREVSSQAQRNGEVASALQSAQDATQTDALSSRIWTRLARAQMASGSFADAEISFARAAQLNPRNNVAWRSWAGARDEMRPSSTRWPLTETLWDKAVACAPRDSSTLLARAKWRLAQGANDTKAIADLQKIVAERDAPYGRYAAIGDYVNLDFARASALLLPRMIKTDKTRAKTLVENALQDVNLARGKVAAQRETAKANVDTEQNLGPPADLDELQKQLEKLRDQ